jgi:metallo-beta-lactamase family protein
MQIIPHGAAREVTGTCHELRLQTGRRVLLDCGLFQGHRAEAAEKNASFAFVPSELDAVVLSHAHGDHLGRLPLLVKRGFRGPIFCTFATRDLAQVMLEDAAYIQEKDEEYVRKHVKSAKLQGPLFGEADVEPCMKLFTPKHYNEWFDVCSGVRAQFLEAGHILGAAMVVLEVEEGAGRWRRIGFTGDLGRSHLPIIRDPAAMPSVEVLICESTYGNRTHDTIEHAREQLRDVVRETAARGGKLLIPAFSLERTQEILYDLHLLWDKREIPGIPIIIDSPLASRVTDVFMKHPECYDREMFEDFLNRAHNPFQFSLVRSTESTDDSKALNGTPGPFIVMAGSGMCEAGRIRHHLKNELEDSRNTVLAVGYMASNTLGAAILDPSREAVKIFDQVVQKRASIRSINAYSGHADCHDLDAFVQSLPGLRHVVLVHGEEDQMLPFAERIRAMHPSATVHVPAREEVIDV